MFTGLTRIKLIETKRIIIKITVMKTVNVDVTETKLSNSNVNIKYISGITSKLNFLPDDT